MLQKIQVILGCYAMSTDKRLIMFQGSAVPSHSEGSRHIAVCLIASLLCQIKNKIEAETMNCKVTRIASGLYI